MKEILLTQGLVALVDDGDYALLAQYKWSASFNGWKWYAVRTVSTNRVKRCIYMHRFILNAPPELQVDHHDGNGLNNQRSNLRLCDNAQNHHNMKALRTNHSGFKGVSWDKERSLWIAFICSRGKRKNLGRFESAQAAAEAYDQAAYLLHGNFAVTNRSLGLLRD